MKTKMRKIEFDLQVKEIDEDKPGMIKFYVSTFGDSPDAHGDIIHPQAFNDFLKELDKFESVKFLAYHDTRMIIGAVRDIKKDKNGLLITAEFDMSDGSDGKKIYNLVKMEALSVTSMGFVVGRESYDDKTGVNTLEKVYLKECSIVPFAANSEAKIVDVKQEEFISVRDTEGLLRDAPFHLSRKDAKIAAEPVYAALKKSLRDALTKNDDDQPFEKCDLSDPELVKIWNDIQTLKQKPTSKQ